MNIVFDFLTLSRINSFELEEIVNVFFNYASLVRYLMHKFFIVQTSLYIETCKSFHNFVIISRVYFIFREYPNILVQRNASYM